MSSNYYIPPNFYIPPNHYTPPNHYIPPNQYIPPYQYIPSPPTTFQFAGPSILPSIPISQPSQCLLMNLAQFQIQMNTMAAALQQQYHATALMHSGTSATPYPPLSIPPGQYPGTHHPPKRWRDYKTGAQNNNPFTHASRMITNGDRAIPHHKWVGSKKNARRNLSGPPSGASKAPHRGHKSKKRKEEKRGYRISDKLGQYVVAKDGKGL